MWNLSTESARKKTNIKWVKKGMSDQMKRLNLREKLDTKYNEVASFLFLNHRMQKYEGN